MKKYLHTIILATFFSFTNAQTEDCNGIIGGPAVVDPCGTCQLAYLYNTISHTVTFLNSTNGISAGANEMVVLPESLGNPYWNDCGQNYNIDCNNIVKGPALLDTCNICRKAYAYNVITHEIIYVNHEDLYDLTDNEIMVMPDSENNPYWNDCTTSTTAQFFNEDVKVIKIIDLLGNELKTIKPNIVHIEFYSDGTYKKQVIIQ